MISPEWPISVVRPGPVGACSAPCWGSPVWLPLRRRSRLQRWCLSLAPGATSAQASASASGFPRSHIQGRSESGRRRSGRFWRPGTSRPYRRQHHRAKSVDHYFDLSPIFHRRDLPLRRRSSVPDESGQNGWQHRSGCAALLPGTGFRLRSLGWYDRDDSGRRRLNNSVCRWNCSRSSWMSGQLLLSHR